VLKLAIRIAGGNSKSHMKRSRFYSHDHHVRTVACTVSAAALMLGVSQAATVGFNFQCNWDDAGAPSYTGKPVTAMAFGIAPQGWENLTPLPTGYGAGNPGPFIGLNEVIDTTTSSGGLNPLPQGSVTVNWSATAGNASGFKGYGLPYGAPNPHPGSEEVYYGFLRDEINIYTSPVPGPIPYSVTITGLRSVWNSNPYAIQLIASTDTGMQITNAFISSVTSTQMVTYDATNLTYPNGIMGGLSTMSGPWTDDSISIHGAPATFGKAGSPPVGYAIASTIAGLIITDKPVVTMSPQQVLVCGGDTVTWAGYAVGVPPLSYQWRKNGVPIPGTTTSTYGITNATTANVGTYDLWITNLYGSAISSAVTVGDEIQTTRISNLVLDSNPKGPAHNGLNHGATWLASSTDSGNVTRTGVMSFNTNQITVAGETNFDSTAGTIMFWMRSSGLADPSGNPATLFDRLTGNGGATGSGNGIVIAQNSDGSVELQIGSGTSLLTTIPTTAKTLSNNLWHQVAVVYDQSGSTATAIYIDGQLDAPGIPLSGWSWQVGQELELGLSHDTNSWQAYYGLMDDVRFYNRVLSSSEITSAYGGALVDTNALVMQLNFTTAPGLGATLTWQCPDTILQSADSVNGPYADVPGAVSPYSVGTQNTAKFFRYRGHTPQVILANPYLM
jgi:hypothetical protein